MSLSAMFFFRAVSCLPGCASLCLFFFRCSVAFCVSFFVLLYISVSSSADPLQFYARRSICFWCSRFISSLSICHALVRSFISSRRYLSAFMFQWRTLSCSNSLTISTFVDGFSIAFLCYGTLAAGCISLRTCCSNTHFFALISIFSDIFICLCSYHGVHSVLVSGFPVWCLHLL